VVDEIEKQLALTNALVEPSRAVLYRYGNISSSSIWYVLSYIESMGGGVRKGDRVWQLGFGSGFKCNSAVWRANRRVRELHMAWEGFDIEKMRAELNELPN
jgi:3-ketoacyl-CoA synthase